MHKKWYEISISSGKKYRLIEDLVDYQAVDNKLFNNNEIDMMTVSEKKLNDALWFGFFIANKDKVNYKNVILITDSDDLTKIIRKIDFLRRDK